MFDDLDDVALAEMVTDLRTKYIALTTGGDVAVVVAEGRRLEYTRGSADQLRSLWLSAKCEMDRRNGGGGGRAIGVEMIG